MSSAEQRTYCSCVSDFGPVSICPLCKGTGYPDIKAMAEKALAYLLSPEGKAEMQRRKKDTDELVEMFRKARDISWERLHARFTI